MTTLCMLKPWTMMMKSYCESSDDESNDEGNSAYSSMHPNANVHVEPTQKYIEQQLPLLRYDDQYHQLCIQTSRAGCLQMMS